MLSSKVRRTNNQRQSILQASRSESLLQQTIASTEKLIDANLAIITAKDTSPEQFKQAIETIESHIDTVGLLKPRIQYVVHLALCQWHMTQADAIAARNHRQHDQPFFISEANADNINKAYLYLNKYKAYYFQEQLNDYQPLYLAGLVHHLVNDSHSAYIFFMRALENGHVLEEHRQVMEEKTHTYLSTWNANEAMTMLEILSAGLNPLLTKTLEELTVNFSSERPRLKTPFYGIRSALAQQKNILFTAIDAIEDPTIRQQTLWLSLIKGTALNKIFKLKNNILAPRWDKGSFRDIINTLEASTPLLMISADSEIGKALLKGENRSLVDYLRTHNRMLATRLPPEPAVVVSLNRASASFPTLIAGNNIKTLTTTGSSLELSAFIPPNAANTANTMSDF